MSQNLFKNGVEATRKSMEASKAREVAKEIKQYGGVDAYNLMDQGDLVPIVVDGMVIGAATSKKDAEAAVEYLSHFTDGKPLTKDTVMEAGMKAMVATKIGKNLMDAKKDDGIKVVDSIKVGSVEYIIDETNELYDVYGGHICNVADVVEAKAEGKLSEELYKEILTSRIKASYPEDCEEDYYDDDCDCCCCDEDEEDW